MIQARRLEAASEKQWHQVQNVMTPSRSPAVRLSPDSLALLLFRSQPPSRSFGSLTTGCSHNKLRCQRFCTPCVARARWLRAMQEQGLHQIADRLLQHRDSYVRLRFSRIWTHQLQQAERLQSRKKPSRPHCVPNRIPIRAVDFRAPLEQFANNDKTFVT
jgi:hypothetical protein